MVSETPGNARLAVLIDADNANPKVLPGLLAEVAKYGVASVKGAYGDWTTPQLGGWKAMLVEHAIQPMQQFANTKRKNATDSAMIIDAMDLLYTRGLDGFCIVSSDSDFTALARRIRESGLRVIGFGEKKTPKAFVAACDHFVHAEDFDRAVNKASSTNAPTTVRGRRPAMPGTKPTKPPKVVEQSTTKKTVTEPTGTSSPNRQALIDAVRERFSDEKVKKDPDGWAPLTDVGRDIKPDLKKPTLGKALKGIDAFEIAEREFGIKGKRTACIRLRPNGG